MNLINYLLKNFIFMHVNLAYVILVKEENLAYVTKALRKSTAQFLLLLLLQTIYRIFKLNFKCSTTHK